jgi:hypothetical protein
MFCDTHDSSPLQANMVDRAPNSGIAWYECWSPPPGIIPEYDFVVLPVFVIFMLLLATVSKRAKKGKCVKIVDTKGGDFA